jgi:hypothetical protein
MGTMVKSQHVIARQRHRGLRDEILDFILDYGDVEQGSGAAWYLIKERSLPRYLQHTRLVELARPWVVMTSEDGREIITAYAREDASHHIRMKCRKAAKRHRPTFGDCFQSDEATPMRLNADAIERRSLLPLGSCSA